MATSGLGSEKFRDADTVVLETVEMHTGGEALRIITSGYPPIKGRTLLEKRRYVKDNLDYLRVLLMAEPRGHFDMYGALLVEKDEAEEEGKEDDADLAVLFMHNEGYSTMCGHAVISLGRYAVDYNLVKPVSPETPVRIHCPCGMVTAHVQYQNGRSGDVWFESVPSFVFAADQKIQLSGYGEVSYDICCGGTFYAVAEAGEFGLSIGTSPLEELQRAGHSLTSKLRELSVPLTHPEGSDICFIYGTVLTDGKDTFSAADPTAQLVVYADRQVDRSPCGSGTMSRIALQFHKGQIGIGQERAFVNSKTGSRFMATALRKVSYASHDDAVVVKVSGRGCYTGEARYWAEEGDTLGKGFLI